MSTSFDKGIEAGKSAVKTLPWLDVLDMSERHHGVRNMFSIGWRVGMSVMFEREFGDA